NNNNNIFLHRVRHVYPSRPEVLVMNDMSLPIPAGNYNPVSGKVFLDGRDIQTLNLRWPRRQISLVSQEPRLFATTVYENIRLGLLGFTFDSEPEEIMFQRIERAARCISHPHRRFINHGKGGVGILPSPTTGPAPR